MRTILWVYVALPPLVGSVLVFEFGPALRRYAERKAASASPPRKLASRVRIYFLILVVVLFATIRIGATLLGRHVAATSILYFFYADLAILVLFIVSSELKIRRSSRHAPPR